MSEKPITVELIETETKHYDLRPVIGKKTFKQNYIRVPFELFNDHIQTIAKLAVIQSQINEIVGGER